MSLTDLDVEAAFVTITANYQAALNELGDLVGAEVAQRFADLEHLNRVDIPAFVDAATPAIRAGQAEAIDLTNAWITEIAGQRPTGVIDLRELPAVEWNNPFLRTWQQLNTGQPWLEARKSGIGEAHRLGQDTTRGAGIHRMGKSGLKTVGYRRVLSAGACEWCQVVSTQRYTSAVSAALGGEHPSCQCTVVAIFGKRDPGQVLSHQRLKELKSSGALKRVSEARARSRSR